MRTWFARWAALAALGTAVCLSAVPAHAVFRVLHAPPAGIDAEAAAAAEPDPLFDEDFDAELDFEDDMARLDPFESVNRKVFWFNRGVDRFFVDPLTRAYRFVVPEPVQNCVYRVFLNLNSPPIFVNELLQLRFKNAAETLGRFVLNSTIGAGGLFDAGKAAGWERHEADFGQTLAKLGIGSGPYLVLPIFGPSTVRDGIGSLIDRMFQPLTYLLGPSELLLQISIGSGSGFATRVANQDELKALQDSSVDFYAALRSAYLQSRRAVCDEVEPAEAAPVEPDPEARAGPAPAVETQ